MSTYFLERAPRFEARRAPRSKPINIQDSFLFASLKEHRRLAFALVTGKAIQGQIVRFDSFTVLVRHGSQETLIYKHAIVAITEVAQEPAAPGPA